ncbi:GATA transcription factor 26 [Nymphaea thermarum]|nr:GATA transcription factor 26 [Nymphaea thermarum]
MVDASGTPLWRNGPPDKPVLCNACGSRWRTKGSLTNYRPLHCRGEAAEPVQCTIPKMRLVLLETKEKKLHKRRLNEVEQESEDGSSDYEPPTEKILEEDSSNRSSSGSAISCSESCAQFGSADAIDYAGTSQSIVWDSLIPSRKRTCLNRRKPKPSPVEKLTKDLCSILHEQESSHLSVSSGEDLLLGSGKPMVSVEIGHGGVLIKHPRSTAQEEESEASSHVIENKGCTVSESYSTSSPLPIYTQNKGADCTEISIDKMKSAMDRGPYDHAKRDKVSYDKFHILQSSSSPLRLVDLKDIINYEEFMEHLTREEQEQLIRYLPSVDSSKFPSSLRKMFDSPSFRETLDTYQRLLSDGVFDLSFSGANIEACKALKRLLLIEATKARWLELYTRFKDSAAASVETKLKIKSPNRLQKCESVDLPSAKSHVNSYAKQAKSNFEENEAAGYDASCFSPRTLFVSPLDRSSVTLDSLQFLDDSSDQDLLLDIPLNVSLQQAELLDCNFWKKSSSTRSTTESHDKQGNQP